MNFYNHTTRITASTLGVLLSLGGIINHGTFEILQGNNPTNGYFIEAIGKSNRFWLHGTEAAFTIIPNFLVTGIVVLIVSVAIMVWSAKYIHVKFGKTIFLILLILLTAFGGGIGHILLVIPAWVYSTRISKPLDWWKNILPGSIRKTLSKLWIYVLILTSFSWLIVMELGIFGYFPGQSNPDVILKIVFSFLFLTVILANFSFICGFAKDIEARESV